MILFLRQIQEVDILMGLSTKTVLTEATDSTEAGPRRLPRKDTYRHHFHHDCEEVLGAFSFCSVIALRPAKSQSGSTLRCLLNLHQVFVVTVKDLLMASRGFVLFAKNPDHLESLFEKPDAQDRQDESPSHPQLANSHVHACIPAFAHPKLS